MWLNANRLDLLTQLRSEMQTWEARPNLAPNQMIRINGDEDVPEIGEDEDI